MKHTENERLRIRSKPEIPLVEHPGYRLRRHVGTYDALEPLPASRPSGFGALRRFDELEIDAGARVPVEAHDGLDVVLHLLEGECLVESDRGEATRVVAGRAASFLLGDGVEHVVSSASTSPARALVVAVAAAEANPRPRVRVGPFQRDAADLAWVETHGGPRALEGLILAGGSVYVALAKLGSGVEVHFPAATDRGLFVFVLEGNIELGTGFVDQGGDARLRLESVARLQAVLPTRLVLAHVPMGYAQRIA